MAQDDIPEVPGSTGPHAQVSEETRDIIDAWFAYGERPYSVPQTPQRTRFQGSRFDFNGEFLPE